ncbi:MAG: hypothetical protein ACOC5G_04050 [Acidobacteriota bacterium]
MKPLGKPKEEIKIERLPDDTGLIKAIADYYVEEWKKTHGRDKVAKTYFYHTDCGKCPRSLYYANKNPEKKKDMGASTIMMFSMGNLFHDELTRVLTKIGATTNKNVEFGMLRRKGKWEASGRLDVFIPVGYTVINGVQYEHLAVAEIKSHDPYSFDMVDPKQKEVDQLIEYIGDCKESAYLKERKKIIMDYGFILYVDRSGMGDPLPVRGWSVNYSNSRMEEINDFFGEVWDAIEEKKIPPRPYERDSVECNYCRFQNWCWRGVPKKEQPKLEKDDSVEKPTKEILESAAVQFIDAKKRIKEAEKEVKKTKKILSNYFTATAEKEVNLKSGDKIKCSMSQSIDVDMDYLWRKCTKKDLKMMANIGIGKMREAVKEGLIDGTTFEKATVPGKKSMTISYKIKKEKKE